MPIVHMRAMIAGVAMLHSYHRKECSELRNEQKEW